MCFQAGDAVRTQDEPYFQSSETATEGDLPIPIIGHETGGGEVVAEIRRRDREGRDQILAPFDVKTAKKN